MKARLALLSQQVGDPEEYLALFGREKISTTSSLQSFNAFTDGQGLMRVSEQLAAASEILYDEKHPIILPYNTHLARLLVHCTRSPCTVVIIWFIG